MSSKKKFINPLKWFKSSTTIPYKRLINYEDKLFPKPNQTYKKYPQPEYKGKGRKRKKQKGGKRKQRGKGIVKLIKRRKHKRI